MAKFQFIKDHAGNTAPQVVEVPVAASQDVYEGDLLILSSNKATLAGASSSTVLAVAENVR